MSNPLTILHNFDQPVYSPDFNTIVSALDYKQTAYSANKAKLQSLYDQLDALKVKKGIDQEYIEGRLQQVKELTNQYNHIDLSNSSFADAMYNNVSQAVDEKVENAVYSTRLWEAEDKKWADFREKKGDKYWEGNEAYSKHMSDRNRYLNSTEAGDKYNGGADILEFQDIDKKALDQLQNIIKNATHQYIQERPGTGQFTSLSTMEVISRPEVEAQLRASMNEKEWQQFKINAWKKYGGADDNYLKARKEEKDTTLLAEVDENLKAVRSAALTAKDEEKAEYETQIQKLETYKENLKNNTYESLIGKIGKEGVYNKLYEDEFFEEYLNGFSYQPREIERKIDETKKAAIEFGEKVREFEATRADNRYEFDNLSAKEKADLEFKAIELKLKYPNQTSDNGNGQIVGSTVYGDKDKPAVEYGDTGEKLGGLALSRKQEMGSKKKMEGIFGELDSKDIYELKGKLSDENLAKAIKAGKITINGKTRTLDRNTLATINEFKRTNIDDTPAKKEAVDVAFESIISATKTISKLASKGSDQDLSDFPAYGVKITGNSKDGFRVEQTKTKTYFKDLARRYGEDPSSLSEAEEKTLQYYVAANITADPNSGLSLDQRSTVMKATRTKIFGGMKASEMEKIPVTVDKVTMAHGLGKDLTSIAVNSDFFVEKVRQLIPKLTAQRSAGWDSKYTLTIPKNVAPTLKKLSDLYQKVYTETNVDKKAEYKSQIKKIENSLQSTSSFVKSGPTAITNYISDISTFDAEYMVKGVEKRVISGATIVGNLKESLDKVDTDLKKFYNKASGTGFSFEKGSTGYDQLLSTAKAQNVAAENYKGPIQIFPSKMTPEGEILEVVLKVPYTSKTAGEQSIKLQESAPINFAQFKAGNPNLPFEQNQRTPYDATYGDNAAKLFIDKSFGYAEASPGNPLFTQADQEVFLYNAKVSGNYDRVRKVLENFQEGKYSYRLEPNNNKTLAVKMYQGSNLVHTYDLGVTRISTDDAIEYQTSQREATITDVTIDYIESINGRK